MRPVMGARLTGTSNTDMKIETCLVRPGQISPSGTSLICTTVPSAGERTSTWCSLPARCGSRKKLMRKSPSRPRTSAATVHCISRAATKRMTMGMRKSQPSLAHGKRRIRRMLMQSGCEVSGSRGLGWWAARPRDHETSQQKGPLARPFQDQFVVGVPLRGHGVAGFVRADPGGHLVLQMEFALLQRLLFDFLVFRHLALRRELVQTRLTLMMFFEPGGKF